jgi:endonuclease/exonuclease/phosphatase family metal-dependent hydrolase
MIPTINKITSLLIRSAIVFAVAACVLPTNSFTQDTTKLIEQPFLNVMTFNIRYNTPRDSANAWSFRKNFVGSQILFHEVHILGVQEALYDQIQDLQERLPAYRRVGVGRDDGATKGEFSAIFFDSTRLEMVTSGTFWLSPTPSVAGSKGWDAALPRIATWATLRDKQSKSTVTVINTHFDHQGVQARKESANLILQKLSAMRPRENALVMGDLNSIPSDAPATIFSSALKDSKAISLTGHYGPTGTFNGFERNELDDNPIDYIFVSSDIEVLRHATLSQSWRGRFSSDHFPVFARLRLK